jgi:hypothetical protein
MARNDWQACSLRCPQRMRVGQRHPLGTADTTALRFVRQRLANEIANKAADYDVLA